ncbi:MAG TPA: nuclear transport factor 2 family protein [Edaphobacter sp.]|nr:nuclear transport factor 2 family protein [Edaphobacter sp.]
MRLLPIPLLTLSLAATTATLVAQSAASFSSASSLDSLIERQGLPPSANADTRDLTDLQLKFEDATIRGDIAFVSSVEDPTMTMVHGDRWTTGGRPQLADDRAAYNQRVASQSYYVHDLDPTSLRYELHRDLAICYGRYLSVVNKPAGSNAPGKITSIWFERVFRKLPGGHWVYLSHRTVHGPINSPAGIDPTRVAWTSTVAEQAKVPLNPPGAYALPPANGANAGVPADKDPTVSKSPEAAEIIAFQTAMEDALVKGDSDFLKKAIADDFSMVHGDIWIRGGLASPVDGKDDLLQYAATRHYTVRDDDHVRIEMHGDVAIAYGRYVSYVPRKAATTPSQGWSSAWYERVYEKQAGQWQIVSHRTVFGPIYGSTRESLGNK